MSDFTAEAGFGDSGNLVHEYMERAARARALGDNMLGLHLFLAAYGQASTEGVPSGEGFSALKEAWALALQLRERSLAEYIFEKMEPALSQDEAKACTNSLQSLTLDKLEEFGISRKDLEEVGQLIQHEIHGARVEEPLAGLPFLPGAPVPELAAPRMQATTQKVQEPTDANKGNADTQEGKQASQEPQNASGEPSAPVPAAGAEGPNITMKTFTLPHIPGLTALGAATVQKAPQPEDADVALAPQSLRYADLSGFAHAIRDARALGIGRDRDPQYNKLVEELNATHGVPEPPAFDPILITAPVREDASRFAYATVGELDLPLYRMYVEESPQGMQALCVYAQDSKTFKYDRRTCLFSGRGVLLLEDLDLWDVPTPPSECEEGMNTILAAQVNRSIREVYNFIRAAVENPDVMVLVTAQQGGAFDPFFHMIMDPFKTLAIQLPTAGERASIWMEVLGDHPSLNGLSVAMLVKNSANMGRFDIYSAVADVLDDTYREDLTSGHASQVKAARLFEKLAAYQPLDSEEYKTLEDAIVQDFRNDLAHLDDLLS